MMTLAEVADTLGVTERSIYGAIKRTRMRWRLEKRRGTYVFSNDDVLDLAHELRRRNFAHLARTLTPNRYAPE